MRRARLQSLVNSPLPPPLDFMGITSNRARASSLINQPTPLAIVKGGTGQSTLLAAGIPYLVGSGDLTGKTGSTNPVATFTTQVLGTFRVGGYAAITAISAGTLTYQVTFTDENSTSQTITFFPMGLTSAGLTTVGFTAFPPAYLRAKAGTAITITTTFVGVSITYDVGGFIEQIT